MIGWHFHEPLAATRRCCGFGHRGNDFGYDRTWLETALALSDHRGGRALRRLNAVGNRRSHRAIAAVDPVGTITIRPITVGPITVGTISFRTISFRTIWPLHAVATVIIALMPRLAVIAHIIAAVAISIPIAIRAVLAIAPLIVVGPLIVAHARPEIAIVSIAVAVTITIAVTVAIAITVSILGTLVAVAFILLTGTIIHSAWLLLVAARLAFGPAHQALATHLIAGLAHIAIVTIFRTVFRSIEAFGPREWARAIDTAAYGLAAILLNLLLAVSQYYSIVMLGMLQVILS